MKKISIFTDGSSKGNPGPGGWGAIIIADNKVAEFGGREELTTNNRMEISAALSPLGSLSKPSTEVTIFTDSSYLLDGITKWAKNWQKYGWQTKTKQKVKNKDLWEKLIAAEEKLSERNVKLIWRKVAGHRGIVLNERADTIAVSFALGKQVKLFSGSFEDYKKILPGGIEFDILFHADHKVLARSHKKAYSYVSRVFGKIETHKDWVNCERRVRGKSGALFRKALSKLDEEAIIREWTTPR